MFVKSLSYFPFTLLNVVSLNSLNVFIIADLSSLLNTTSGLTQNLFTALFLEYGLHFPVFLCMSHNFLLKTVQYIFEVIETLVLDFSPRRVVVVVVFSNLPALNLWGLFPW